MADISDEEYVQKCHDDPLWFIESNLQIAPKAGGLCRFVLNDDQLDFFKLFWSRWSAGEPVRIITLKARQRGISTLAEALAYWLVSTREHSNALTISHDLDSAHHILEMCHRFSNYDGRLERGLMPDKAKSNRSEIVFDNADWRARGTNPGLDSRIIVGTADSKNTGHSHTFQFVHWSEVARAPRVELITGVMAALPFKANTVAILESTANGRGNYFYETWKQAEKGRGIWIPHFIPWNRAPEYRMKLGPKQAEIFRDQMTEEELKLEKTHSLSIEQLAWRRKQIESYQGTGRPAEDVFREQYPITPEEAFISTGRQYFDMKSVALYEEAAKEARFTEGWLELVHPIVKNRPKGVKFHPRKPLDGHQSMLRLWEPPVEGADYVIGADVAMGLSGGDRSVAFVLRRDNNSVVAKIAGQIEPDVFADMLIELGWFYNEAFLCPENNSIGMAVAKKTSSKYTRHAYQIDLSTPGNPRYNLDKPGWNTNAGNRREMFAYLRQQVRDKVLRVWDEDLLAEMNDFVVPEGLDGRMKESTPRASAHKHDDHVAALAITLQANDPMMAGVIRKRQTTNEQDLSWSQAALKADIGREHEKRVVYDEHMGRFE